MKNQKAADFYDKLYADNKNAFAGEPNQLVQKLCEFLPSGTVLDIGSGAGRNALFLAAKGYSVTATDISAVSTERLATFAKEKGLALETAVFDITEQELVNEYDAVICAFLLHLLTTTDAENVIRQMQKHTKPGGFNLILAFTKDGDFFRNHPLTPNFYAENKDQLGAFYLDWKIIESTEKESRALAKTVDGKPQFNMCVHFLAQKPYSHLVL